MQALKLLFYRERYNFNRQLLCRPFIFRSHVGGGGGNKDLPEISRLDQVELQFGGKRDYCRRRVETKFRMSRVNSAMNFVYIIISFLESWRLSNATQHQNSRVL